MAIAVPDIDRLLGSPFLILGLFAALVLALGALAWLVVAQTEARARAAADKALLDLVFTQISQANTALAARRDVLEAAFAALPAGVELRDAAGQLLLRNPHAAACGGLSGQDGVRKLPDGRLLEIRRAPLPDGGSVALSLEIDLHAPHFSPLTDPFVEAIEPSLSLQASRRNRRALVLLVEDIPVNQVVTATALQRAGAHVDIAGSGAEALAKIARTPYEIVLMDLMMPGMSGYDAARAIRALPGFAGRVPIYALTATASQADRARCREAGMQGMLTKPVRPHELADVLDGILQPTAGVARAPVADGIDRLLDAVRLAELQRGLPDGMFIELVEQALGDMSARLGGLHAALARGHAASIVAEAHALAGIAGSYGLLAFDRQMRAVLSAVRAGNLGAARQAGDGMVAALDESGAALRAMLRPATARAGFA